MVRSLSDEREAALWSAHDNQPHLRWTLREYGVTLAGPEPEDFVAPVPADVLRYTMRCYLPQILDEGMRRWLHIAWMQRDAVTSYCRALYTLQNGRVISKPASLRWVMDGESVTVTVTCRRRGPMRRRARATE